jgi:hypothetical protein
MGGPRRKLEPELPPISQYQRGIVPYSQSAANSHCTLSPSANLTALTLAPIAPNTTRPQIPKAPDASSARSRPRSTQVGQCRSSTNAASRTTTARR